MENAFEVKLACSWIYAPSLAGGIKHVINLYHDSFTGVRMASLDFEEIVGSSGNSSLVSMMRNSKHKINFIVEGRTGFIEIAKESWTQFSYRCVIDNVLIQKSSNLFVKESERQYKSSVVGTVNLPGLVWYTIQTTRMLDMTVTTVHR